MTTEMSDAGMCIAWMVLGLVLGFGLAVLTERVHEHPGLRAEHLPAEGAG